MNIKLSFSAAQRYLLSPASYYFHYLLRLRPSQLSSPLIFGGALDIGFNSLLSDIKNGHGPDLEAAIDVFEQAFSYVSDNGETLELAQDFTSVKYSKADLDKNLLSEEEVKSGLNLSWISLKNKGKIMLEEYYDQVLPQIQKVLAVQLEINLPNNEGDALIGIVDFIAEIDGKRYIIDNKSTSIAYKEDSADKSEQLHTYFEALKDEYKLDGIMYVTISKKVRSRKLPRIEIRLIPGEVSEEIMTQTFDKYEYVLQGIRNKEFDCSGMCLKTPWSCSYKNYCKSGGTDMSGLTVHKERKKIT